jgi:methylglyoxal synthase
VKALLRLAVLYNIPTASNRATADFLISSQFMSQSYERLIPDYLDRLKTAAEEYLE